MAGLAVFLGFGGWLLLCGIVFAQPQNRLECLSCEKISKPQDCLFKRLCPPDEYCFTEHYITAEGHVFYNLGCKPTSICSTARINTVVGRREIPNEAVVVCEQCCDGKYCNQHLCGGIDPPQPKCLSCTNMHNPTFCEHLKLCEPHESCSIQEILTPDFNLVYDLGCTDNVICDVLTNNLAPGGLCVNCCNSSLCNDQCILPTTPPPTTTPPSTTRSIIQQICATMPPDVTVPAPHVSASILTQLGCGSLEDIVFLVDESRNITNDEEKVFQAFVDNFILSLKLGPTAGRVGYTVYGSNPHDVITLKDGDDVRKVDAILTQFKADSNRSREDSDLAKALVHVHSQYFVGNKGRPGAKNLVVVLSASDPNHPSQAIKAADDLRKDGVDVAVALVDNGLDTHTWTQIASSPSNRFLLDTSNFKRLIQQMEDLLLTRCLPVGAVPTFPTTVCGNNNLLNLLGCGAKEDIVIILDRSGSIGHADWPKMVNFTKGLVNVFNVSPNASRVAALSYSRDLSEHFNLTEFSHKADLLRAIDNTLGKLTTNGDTYTNLALDRAREIFRSEGRPDAVKVVVIMTDGGSDTKLETLSSAARLHLDDVQVFVIGIGNEVDLREQAILATDPDNFHMLSVIDQNSLLFYLDLLAVQRCLQNSTTASPITTPIPSVLTTTTGASNHATPVVATSIPVVHTTTSAPVTPGPSSSGPVAVASTSGAVVVDTTTAAPLTAGPSSPGLQTVVATNLQPATTDAMTSDSATAATTTAAATTAAATTDAPMTPGPSTVPPAMTTSGLDVTTVDPYEAICLPVSPSVLQPPPEVAQSLLAKLGCGDKEDIIFLVDMAGHVTDQHEMLLQAFIDNIVLAINMSDTSARVGYTGYASTFHDVITLPQGVNLTYVDSVLRGFLANFSRQHDTANLANALRHLYNRYFSRGAIRHGARPVVVIVPELDRSEDPLHPGLAIQLAQNLTAMGVDVVVALVRTTVHSDNIWRQIASSPNHFLTASSFEGLVTLLEDVLLTRCPGTPVTTPPLRLCAKQNSLTDLGCSKPQDVILMLDRSADVSDDDWNKMTAFASKFLGQVQGLPGSDVHAGVISYGSDVRENVGLTDLRSTSDLPSRAQASLQGEKVGGENRADGALTRAQEDLKVNGRSGTEKVVIWVTAGPSQQKLMTLSAAARLRSQGVTVFSLGVGPKVDLKELAVVASNPDVTHMMAARDADALSDYLDLLTSSRCRAPATP